jgi:hypothetical protein
MKRLDEDEDESIWKPMQKAQMRTEEKKAQMQKEVIQRKRRNLFNAQSEGAHGLLTLYCEALELTIDNAHPLKGTAQSVLPEDSARHLRLSLLRTLVCLLTASKTSEDRDDLTYMTPLPKSVRAVWERCTACPVYEHFVRYMQSQSQLLKAQDDRLPLHTTAGGKGQEATKEKALAVVDMPFVR